MRGATRSTFLIGLVAAATALASTPVSARQPVDAAVSTERFLKSASSQTVEVHELFRYITDEGVVPQRFARHPHYELCRCVLLPVPVRILTQP